MAKTLLRKMALFQNLSEEHLDAIAALLKERSFKAGQAVLQEGEEGDEMYIVREGQVAISKAIHVDIPGRGEVNFEKQLVELGAGAYFGEISLLAPEARSATVTAKSDLQVWILESDPMQKLMGADTDLGYHLLSLMSKELCKRLRNSNEDVTKLMRAFAIAIHR